jgi:hypothetical protein
MTTQLKITKIVNNLVVKKTVTKLIVKPFDTGIKAILCELIKAKGELIVGTGFESVDSLSAPVEGDVLTGSPGSPKGVVWAPAAGGSVENDVNDFRLTLESGVPVSTTDQTAKTVIYFTPAGKGNRISLYSGAWVKRNSAELSIKLTDVQNGNTISGSKTVAGLSDTTQFIVGMEVTGTGIAASSTVASIDTSTQVTLNNNATATNTGTTITFKIPASKNVDLVLYDNNGVPKLEFVAPWTNDSARAVALTTQDGVYSKTGDATRRYVGTIRTTETAGQTEDSLVKRFVWNFYNKVIRSLSCAQEISHTYNGAWRKWNNSDINNKLEFVMGLQLDSYFGSQYSNQNGGNAVGTVYMFMDGSGCSNLLVDSSSSSETIGASGTAMLDISQGYHYTQSYEMGSSASSRFNRMGMHISGPM